jgi:DNA mismatch repair protein MutH
MIDEQLNLIAPPPELTRPEAIERLEKIVGDDLRPMAEQHGITVWKEGRLNKGWAGQVVEAYLGRSPNSDKAADFGEWELKVVSLVANAQGELRPKESMAIAMFTEAELEEQAFEESHLLEKLGKLIVVARLYSGPDESSSIVLGWALFDLEHPTIYNQVVEDYEEARWVVRNEGVHALGGGIGRLVQTRVKGGAGAGRGGHCFYARSQFVGYILGLSEDPFGSN